MKIELDVPEWALGRHIYIIAGSEVIAKKLLIKANPIQYGPTLIKKVRCNLCGECCELNRADWHLGIDPTTGACAYLKYEKWMEDNTERSGWLCTAPSTVKPWACVKGKGDVGDNCIIEFEEG